MTLVEFLKARLDEDEAAARRAVPGPWATQGAPRETVVYSAPTAVSVALGWIRDLGHIARHDPARVLAEVDAKRRLVEAHEPTEDGHCSDCLTGESDLYGRSYETSPCWHLRVLALPYAGHADYDKVDWKP